MIKIESTKIRFRVIRKLELLPKNRIRLTYDCYTYKKRFAERRTRTFILYSLGAPKDRLIVTKMK